MLARTAQAAATEQAAHRAAQERQRHAVRDIDCSDRASHVHGYRYLIDTDKLRCGSLQLNSRPFQSIPALRAKVLKTRTAPFTVI
jgi:hypothetical protein